MAETPEYITYGDGFADVTLSRALDVDGAKVSTLRMREPSVGDQRAASKVKGSDEEQELALVANLASMTPADIDRLSLRDYKRVQEALVGFIV